MAKHRWQKKSIKGKGAWPSLPTPKIPLCFFRKGALLFLQSNGQGRIPDIPQTEKKSSEMSAAGWTLCYTNCSRIVFAAHTRMWHFEGSHCWGVRASQCPWSQPSLAFLQPARRCKLNWLDMQQVAWLPSVCLRFSKNLSRASFLYLSDGFWQDGLFPVRPRAPVHSSDLTTYVKKHTHTQKNTAFLLPSPHYRIIPLAFIFFQHCQFINDSFHDPRVCGPRSQPGSCSETRQAEIRT